MPLVAAGITDDGASLLDTVLGAADIDAVAFPAPSEGKSENVGALDKDDGLLPRPEGARLCRDRSGDLHDGVLNAGIILEWDPERGGSWTA